MYRRFMAVSVLFAALFAATGAWAAADSTATMLGAKDLAFVKEAAGGGLYEVKAGQLAEKNASDDSVKAFGTQMETDHTKINDDLKAVVQGKNVTFPEKLSGTMARTYLVLSKKTGAAFDKAYMADMVRDHTQDVAAFRRMSKVIQDPALHGFITRTLPIIEMHLAMAKRIQANLKPAGGM